MPAPASRPTLAVAGKLDRSATVAALRRCVDTLLRKGRFELSFEIQTAESPAAPDAASLENPEILVIFHGRDQDLLLERNAELLKALEHIALRWMWLDPQFYDRVRFDACGYRAARIQELKLSAQVAAAQVRETHAPFRFNAMAAGIKPKMVLGERRNLKITTFEDLSYARELVEKGLVGFPAMNVRSGRGPSHG